MVLFLFYLWMMTPFEDEYIKLIIQIHLNKGFILKDA